MSIVGGVAQAPLSLVSRGSLVSRVLIVAGGVIAGLSVVSGCSAASTAPPSAVPTGSQSSQIDCNVIDDSAPETSAVVIGDVVALAIGPQAEPLQLVDDPGTEDITNRLWSKTPIWVRAGSSWTLVVDDDALDHLRMGWGSPAAPSKAVIAPDCPSSPTTASGWWVFPGGFWADQPGCYSVRLEADGRTTPVRIPLGVTC